MSDFDREAERERLREKYEQDKKEREATEQMSELLLQGATMTNAHCSECGDPIFRYDGQEFCPTCERPVERESGAGADETEDEGDGSVEVTSPRDDTRVVFGDGESESTPERRTREGDSETDRQEQTRETQQDKLASGDRKQESDPGVRDAPRQVEKPARQRNPAAPVETDDHSGDAGAGVEAARASLVRTLATFSQRAETTDDPRRAREHLQTAREAAETLAVLRR